MTLMDKFGTDEHCRKVLEELRWPNGPRCPRCDSDKLSRMYERDQFDCDSCRYQFSVMAGTIFHDTHLPLRKWFIATFLICESKKGMSANQLKRMLGVSYKTAWYLCHRIRAAMGDARTQPQLNGTIEADETWVRGKRRHVGQGYIENKTQVLGAMVRGGEVRLSVYERGQRADGAALHAFIKSVVADEAPAIYTDENPGYAGIGDHDTIHAAVNHAAEEWVRGEVHTNTAESVWSLLKRSIIGSYHQLSTKHLDAYLGELEWRFNNRDNPYLFRDTLIRLLESDNLTYKKLTSSASA